MKIKYLLWGFIFSFVVAMGGGVFAQELYRTTAKEWGLSSLDFSADEIKRTERLSVLRIPGFHERSAAASRWLMCVYTDIAKKRGFQYWVVVYPEPPSEDVIVGFPRSQSESIVSTLGPEFGTKNVLPTMPVQKMTLFCEKVKQR